MNIKYETLEKLETPSPVNRLDYISEACAGKKVFDIGCFDETALIKRETKHWLHGRIVSKAKSVIGIDNSSLIPNEGIRSGKQAKIYPGNGVHPNDLIIKEAIDCDIIVAGEFIEHIENPLEFFRQMKETFPGREMIISTPNGTSLSNTLLGLIGREAQHQDHLHAFTYKTLHTLCLKSGFNNWSITPYHFFATEMIMNSSGLKKTSVIAIEKIIQLTEKGFPLLSMGYIVRIKI